MSASYGTVVPWIVRMADYQGDDCLAWPYAKLPSGYGKLVVGGTHWLAHRYMCFLVNGLPPSFVHQAAHSCGNGHLGCVNPKHLRWATPKDNAADTQATKNHDRGENNPAAKLTEDDVVSIRHLCQSGLSQSKVARMFGVASETVFGIYRAKRWPHVTRNHTVVVSVPM